MEEGYGKFLKKLADASLEYLKIVVPQEIDYENKSQYFYIIEACENLNNTFNIIQSRIVLLALRDAYFTRSIISGAMLKKVLQTIERFHFVFNALLAQRTSTLEKIYSNFSLKLRKCISKEDAHRLIEELIRDLNSRMPNFDSFKEKFVKLEYSAKTNLPSNLKTKYAIYAIAKYFAEMDVIPNDASIEHIANENSTVSSKLNIGNLLILEKTINETIPASANFEEKKSFYKKSRYPFVADFNNQNHAKWDNEEILNRAEILARLFYEKILGKSIS